MGVATYTIMPLMLPCLTSSNQPQLLDGYLRIKSMLGEWIEHTAQSIIKGLLKTGVKHLGSAMDHVHTLQNVWMKPLLDAFLFLEIE